MVDACAPHSCSHLAAACLLPTVLCNTIFQFDAATQFRLRFTRALLCQWIPLLLLFFCHACRYISVVVNQFSRKKNTPSSMHKQNQFELNKYVRNLSAVVATYVRLSSCGNSKVLKWLTSFGSSTARTTDSGSLEHANAKLKKKNDRKSSRQTLSFSSVARFKCADVHIGIDLCRSIWTSKSFNVLVLFWNSPGWPQFAHSKSLSAHTTLSQGNSIS